MNYWAQFMFWSTRIGLAILMTGSAYFLFSSDPPEPLDDILGRPLVSAASIVESQPAGAVPGALEVGPTGEARFRIPIALPAGRSGVAPSLSLHYSSRGGNGLLGVGFTLSGLSSIGRCGRSLARDGATEGIHLDESDAFCLDGSRLVAVSGEYGAGGTEYRTEQDRYARILSDGRSGGAPILFVVLMRDGTVRTYSRRLTGHIVRPTDPEGTAPLIDAARVTWKWLLREVKDRAGNHMLYNYTVHEDRSDLALEYRPSSITYTHNRSGEANREVRFHYEDRSDPIESYVAGLRLRQSKRLSRIDTFAPNPTLKQLVHSYRLSYRNDSITGRSLLASVAICDRWDLCLPATELRWELGTMRYETIRTGLRAGTDITREPSIQLADFDGDGRDDLLYWHGDAEECECQDPLCDQPMTFGGWRSSPQCKEWTAHVRGEWMVAFSDGRDFGPPVGTGLTTDFVTNWEYQGGALGTERILLDAIPMGQIPDEYGPPNVADVNGDDRADLISTRAGSILLGPNFIAAADAIGSTFDHEAPNKVPDARYFGDFDGDGRLDLLTHSRRGVPAALFGWVFRRHGREAASFAAPQAASISPFHSWEHVDFRLAIYAQDFDGDNRTEIVYPADTNGFKMFGLTPEGGPEVRDINLRRDWSGEGVFPGGDYRFVDRMVDMNGDGLPDVVEVDGAGRNSPRRLRARLNTGRGFAPWFDAMASGYLPPKDERHVPTRGLAYTYAPVVDDGIRVLDINGDGRQDMLVPTEDGPKLYVSRGTGFRIDNAPLPLVDPVRVAASDFGDSEWFSLNDAFQSHPGHFIGYSHKVGDVDGDGLPDVVQYRPTSGFEILRHRGSPPDRLVSIIDGFGRTDSVEYASVTDGRVYTPSDDCAYPQRCLRRGMQVVRSVYRDNGAGGRRETRYHYADGRSDVRGLGFLGFASVSVEDRANGRLTEISFDNRTSSNDRYVFAFLPQRVVRTLRLRSSGVTHVDVETHGYAIRWRPGEKVFDLRQRNTDAAHYEFTHAVPETFDARGALRSTAFSEQYDSFGNPIVTEIARGGRVAASSEDAIDVPETIGTRLRVERGFENREGRWLIGLLELRRKTLFTAGRHETQTTVWEYDELGQLIKEVVEPDDPQLYLETRYIRSPDGLVERLEQKSPRDPLDLQVRTTSFSYDAERIYLRSIENALGHVSKIGFHPALGVEVAFVDPNGLRDEARYDTFGRLREVRPPDGGTVRYDYVAGDRWNWRHAAELHVAKESGGRMEVVYDRLGRNTLRRARAADGRWTLSLTDYDHLGRVWRVSEPKFEGERSYYTTFRYDVADRLLGVERPDGTRWRRSYEPFATHAWDAVDNHGEVRFDVEGRVVASLQTLVEAVGPRRILETRYAFGPLGKVEEIRDAAGNVTRIRYDRLGRRTLVDDPDAGRRSFRYNVFGELIEQSDPEHPGIPTEYRRDALGRVIEIRSVDGIASFVWDRTMEGTAGRDFIGEVHAATSTDGVMTRTIFDEFGRPARERLHAGGRWYTVQYGYDRHGRRKTLHYPASVLGQPNVRYEYGQFGHLEHVVDGRSGRALWSAVERDSRGRVVDERFRNGVRTDRTYEPESGRLLHMETKRVRSERVRLPISGLGSRWIPVRSVHVYQALDYGYDDNGLLEERYDSKLGRHERFEHDSLGRLARWKVDSGASLFGDRLTEYGYDDSGNLESTRTHDVSGSFQESLLFGERGAGPHAVTTYRSQRFVPNQGLEADRATFGYDAGGRRIRGWQGRELTYSSFDLPLAVRDDRGLTTFQYSADQQRALKRTPDGRSTVYFARLYEHRSGPGGDSHHYYVHTPEGLIAELVHDESGNDALTRFVHEDRLGSASLITGNTVSRRFHAPFGAPVDTAGLPSRLPLPELSRSFTGHEHDVGSGLIQMRGRAFDPLTRAFLTPDPLVGAPLFGQALNRYSYVMNSPLAFVDPSGFQQSAIDRIEERFLAGFELGPESAPDPESFPYLPEAVDEGEDWERSIGDPAHTVVGISGASGDHGGSTSSARQAQQQEGGVSWWNVNHPVWDHVASAADGIGGAVSFGVTTWINDRSLGRHTIDRSSWAYRVGAITGTAFTVAATGQAASSLSAALTARPVATSALIGGLWNATAQASLDSLLSESGPHAGASASAFVFGGLTGGVGAAASSGSITTQIVANTLTGAGANTLNTLAVNLAHGRDPLRGILTSPVYGAAGGGFGTAVGARVAAASQARALAQVEPTVAPVDIRRLLEVEAAANRRGVWWGSSASTLIGNAPGGPTYPSD